MKKKLSYVVSKTPLRVSFLGGGTDISYFYEKFNGATINTAINKFVYVTIKRHSRYFIENYRLNYHDSENTLSIDKIKNSIIRETLKYFNIKEKLYISVVADVPTGSGLGGSSSFIVGLINAICKLETIKISKKKIYEIATHIEIKIIRSPIGKQDHIPAVFGGLIYTRYLKNDKVIIKKMNYGGNLKPMNLLWTMKTRDANVVLESQKKKLKQNLDNLIQIKNMADKYYIQTKKKKKIDLKNLIMLVNKSWFLKKSLSKMISFNLVDKILLRSNNQNLGGKLLGAGGGGFILLIGQIKNSIKRKYITESIKVYKKGTEIILAK